MADPNESQLLNQTIPKNDLTLNVNGGVYVNIIHYSMDARAKIVKIYEEFKARDPGNWVPITRVDKFYSGENTDIGMIF